MHIILPCRNSIWLCCLVIFFIGRFCYFAFTSSVSGDGGVYLQVATTLLEGGYFWDYAWSPFFAKEVTVGLPFLLPSAVILKAGGINLFTAQLCNVLYFVALCWIVFLIGKFTESCQSDSPRWTKYLALLLFLPFPYIQLYGSSGYGEIPSVFWFLLSCYFLFVKNWKRTHYYHLMSGGVIAGISILSKTLLCIGVVGIVISLFWHEHLNRDNVLFFFKRKLPLFVCGLLLPLLAMEVYRIFVLDGIANYLSWLKGEYIFFLSCLQKPISNIPLEAFSCYDSFRFHCKLLLSLWGIPLHQYPLAGLALAIEWGTILFVLLTCRPKKVEYSHEIWCVVNNSKKVAAWRLLCAFSITSCIYFLWWFLIVPPTGYRRWMTQACILLALAYALALTMFISMQFSRWKKMCFIYFPFLFVFALNLYNIIPLLDKNTSTYGKEATREVMQVSEWIRTQENSDFFVRFGFVVAPIRLYSATFFNDFNRVPLLRMSQNKKYFVTEVYEKEKSMVFHDVAARFKLIDIFPDNKKFKIFQFLPQEWQALKCEIGEEEGVKCSLYSLAGYKHVVGVEADNWIVSDSEILLRSFREKTDFFIEMELPPINDYFYMDNVTFVVHMNGEEVFKHVFSDLRNGWAGKLKISREKMNFLPESIVNIRILCNNVTRVDNLWIEMPKSAHLKSIGFSDPPLDEGK